jgi:hypothetical protein
MAKKGKSEAPDEVPAEPSDSPDRYVPALTSTAVEKSVEDTAPGMLIPSSGRGGSRV